MIHIHCACGALAEVSELYAGGQVLCQACGAMVLVPADLTAEDKFRFHCPHCETRVVARKSSAGKKSQCPVCEKVYIVPEPPPESISLPQKDSRRIEIGTDELALRIGLPFPVGKLDPVISNPLSRGICTIRTSTRKRRDMPSAARARLADPARLRRPNRRAAG